MSSMIEVQTKTDGRLARSAWREEARQMKRDGASVTDIAAKFGKSRSVVDLATRGIRSHYNHLIGKPRASGRKSMGGASGFTMGTLKRVAISFNSEQIAAINIIAEEKDISFSKAVSDLVDAALGAL